MPTVRRIGPARFFFYSDEGREAPHMHVEQGEGVAKFWLNPVSLASAARLKGHEFRQLETLVVENRREFLKAWHEHFFRP